MSETTRPQTRGAAVERHLEKSQLAPRAAWKSLSTFAGVVAGVCQVWTLIGANISLLCRAELRVRFPANARFLPLLVLPR